MAPIALATLATLAWGAASHAATVTALQGQVLVSSGAGYRLVDGSIPVGPGGTVVANPGATARVTYGGDCEVTVQPGSIYAIASQSPCADGDRSSARTAEKTQLAAAGPALGGGVAAGAAAASTAAGAAASPPASTPAATGGAAGLGAMSPWLIGAAAAAAGGGVAYYVMSISP